jgi:hypothetical protein
MRRKSTEKSIEASALVVRSKAAREPATRNSPMLETTMPRRQPRRFTTGRNQQLNLKATPQTIERFYRLADEKRLTLCETLELALEALEHADGSP